jgi:hypothetical protein
VWARIKQYWDGPRWIRVTDDERNLRFVGLNVPKTMLDVAKERLQGDPEAELKLALLARDPMANQPIEVQNPIAEMDVDIIIDEGMDTPTVQAEQFDTLTKIMPAMTQLPPPVLRLLITASSLRDKDKLLEIVDQMEQQAQASQEQQMMQQIQIAGAKAEVEKTQSETARNYAQAQAANPQAEMEMRQAEAQSKIAIAEHKAQTDMQIGAMKAQQGMQHADEKHQFGMAMQAQQAEQRAQMAKQQERATA